MAAAEGLKKRQELLDAGFTGQEVAEWESQTRRELSDAGFSSKEADSYFGVQEPDMSAVRQIIQDNLKATPVPTEANRSPAGLRDLPPATNAMQPVPKHEADSFLEALEAGFQISVTGLLKNGKLPDTVVPEHSNMFYRIASQVGTLAGDFPFMVAGGALGGAAGAAAGSAVAPGTGTAVGAVLGRGAGSFALPAAMRTALVQHYEKGDIKDFPDFWERTSAVFLESLKQGGIGAATAGAGALAKAGTAAMAIPTAAKTTAVATSEIATMVTLGKAIEGEVPNAQDFVDAALVVGTMHAAGAGSGLVSSKLRSIYAKTGVRPDAVAQEALTDPVLKQELLSSNVEVPAKFQAAGAESTPVKAAETVAEPAAKTEPAPAAEPKTAQERILSQIGEAPDAQAKKYTFQNFYKDFVDRFDPIKRLTEALDEKGNLPAEKDPYITARMATDYGGKVRHFFEKGTLDQATLETNGKAFFDIIEPHKNEMEGFKAYLLSKRAIELERRGIKSGFDMDAAMQVVAEGKRFEPAAQEFVDFNNRILKYAKDSGLISEEAMGKMVEAGKSYVSLKRVFEDPNEGAGKGGGNPFKRIKGSERKIQDPFISVIENTEAILQRAEQNRAVSNFVELAEQNPEVSGIQRVAAKMAPIEVKSDEVARFLKSQGIEADPESFTIFRAQSRPLAHDEFEVFRNGKREVYKADPAVAEAIKAIRGEPTATNIFFKIARNLTAVKKFGIAISPDFMVKNALRDQMTAGVFSEGSTTPFKDMALAIKDIVGESDAYYNWLKSGGGNSSFLDLKEHYLDKNIFKVDQEAGGFLSKTWNILKKPVDVMAAAGQVIEEASRLAEYKNVSKGDASGTNVFRGGYASREVTVDFQRMGAKLSALNAITAFQNVQIQGLDRTMRAVKQDPTGTVTRAAMYITTPSVLLWYANHEDPRWKEIPNWQKDLFWIVMTKDQIYRIPKPQELGIVFGSGVERALDAFFTDNPHAYKEFGKTIGGALTPAMIPDVVSAPMEHYFNKSFFTGGPIVPHSLEKILPEYQYTEYTSETAKQLGKFVAAVPGGKDLSIGSPAVIENYVRSWSGTLGTYILQIADQALVKSGAVPDPVKPASTLSDIPVIKAFAARFPSASAQSIQDFYDRHEENKKVVDTIRFLAKSGNFDDWEKEMMLEENQPKLVALDGMKDALANQMKFIRFVYKNKDFNPDEKRQLIDGTYYQMIQIAREGNQMFDEIEKSLKAKR